MGLGFPVVVFSSEHIILSYLFNLTSSLSTTPTIKLIYSRRSLILLEVFTEQVYNKEYCTPYQFLWEALKF